MNDAPERPSKSELKRRSADLQALGESLIDLPASELDALPLPDALRDAVLAAQRITKHGGLYRQRQYIGKLMRKIDAEPIRAAMESRRTEERAAAMRFRRIEHWRDRLLQEGAAALAELRAEAPELDEARIAALISQAQADRRAQRTGRAARELFQTLRAALER